MPLLPAGSKKKHITEAEVAEARSEKNQRYRKNKYRAGRRQISLWTRYPRAEKDEFRVIEDVGQISDQTSYLVCKLDDSQVYEKLGTKAKKEIKATGILPVSRLAKALIRGEKSIRLVISGEQVLAIVEEIKPLGENPYTELD